MEEAKWVQFQATFRISHLGGYACDENYSLFLGKGAGSSESYTSHSSTKLDWHHMGVPGLFPHNNNKGIKNFSKIMLLMEISGLDIYSKWLKVPIS